MKIDIKKSTGLKVSPKHIREDPRKVYVEEFGDLIRPEEFFGYESVQHAAKFLYRQTPQPSCVGEGGSRGAGCLEFKENSILVKHSPMGMVAIIKTFIEKNTGWGAMLESAPKGLQNFGCPLEDDYPSNYSLPWASFVDAKRIPEIVLAKGEKYRIKTYAWCHNNLDSYKLAIFRGEGHIVQTGVLLSGPGWRTGHVRPPKESEEVGGHNIEGFGYDKDHVYFPNSWGEWGLTLYLKLKKDKWGKYYVKGTKYDHDIKVRGVARIGKDYELARWGGMELLFRGYIYTDLPNNLAIRTKMLKLVIIKNKPEVYALLDDERYWITPLEMLKKGIGKMWGEKEMSLLDIYKKSIAEITDEEAEKYPLVGIFGRFGFGSWFKYNFILK